MDTIIILLQLFIIFASYECVYLKFKLRKYLSIKTNRIQELQGAYPLIF